MHVISLDDTERPAATVKLKREKDGDLGACPIKIFRTSRTSENALLEHVGTLLSSFIIVI